MFAGSCQSNPYHNQWVVSSLTLPIIVCHCSKVKETDSLLGATRRLLSVTCDCLVQLSHDWKLKEADRSVKDPELVGICWEFSLGFSQTGILRVSKTGPSGWVETNSEFKRQSAWDSSFIQESVVQAEMWLLNHRVGSMQSWQDWFLDSRFIQHPVQYFAMVTLCPTKSSEHRLRLEFLISTDSFGFYVS